MFPSYTIKKAVIAGREAIMKRVREGDIILINGKGYVFTKITALLFRLALKIKQEDGQLPKGFLSLKNLTRPGVKYYKPGLFKIEEVVEAVEKAQRNKSVTKP